MTKRGILLVALVLSPLLAVAAKQPSAYPGFVRLSLAGSKLAGEGSDFVKYDPREHYYLIATGDCDGESIDLILTPSPAGSGLCDSDRDFFEDQPVQRVALPRLRDGAGVNIGDTPRMVRQKLGAAPRYSWATPDRKVRKWLYFANITMPSRQSRGIQMYIATYIFHNEHLWSIGYNVQGSADEAN